MQTGIVLVAFGAPAYGCLAFNMALSLKVHSPEVKIHLLYEESAIRYLQDKHFKCFDSLQVINQGDLYIDSSLDPGRFKSRLYKYLPFDNNLYLDSDGCALKQIEPLITRCLQKGVPFLTQVSDWHTIQQGREIPNMIWAWADDIWPHYKLLPDMRLPATNSSFLFIKKSAISERIYHEMQNAYENALPVEKLRYKWGGGQPDELALNVACAKLRYNPDVECEPVFFSQKHVGNVSSLSDKHYILGLYGGKGFSAKSLCDYYDRLIHRMSMEKLGVNQEFKYHYLVKDKWAGRR